MKIGIIGGSGLYDLDALENVESKEMETPFGSPSDVYTHGTLKEREVYFLPRHGRGHGLLPSEINHKANILGFKKLGVECILSVGAVGSLKEKLRPRDIVLPDQYFDRTKRSLEHTFFGNGIVGHISFAEPACPELRRVVAEAASAAIESKAGKLDVRVNEGGTYVNMEGPAFSTKAESNVYRRFGFDVIGMTSLPEAKLCREAEICYQAMAMVTDYDCWHETEEPVAVEMLIGHLKANTALAKDVLLELAPRIPEKRRCACGNVVRNAVLTAPKSIPRETRKALEPIVGRYL